VRPTARTSKTTSSEAQPQRSTGAPGGARLHLGGTPQTAVVIVRLLFPSKFLKKNKTLNWMNNIVLRFPSWTKHSRSALRERRTPKRWRRRVCGRRRGSSGFPCLGLGIWRRTPVPVSRPPFPQLHRTSRSSADSTRSLTPRPALSPNGADSYAVRSWDSQRLKRPSEPPSEPPPALPLDLVVRDSRGLRAVRRRVHFEIVEEARRFLLHHAQHRQRHAPDLELRAFGRA
jgi:hypothetical protein